MAAPAVEVGQRVLPLDGEALGWMHEFDGALSDGAAMRAQLERDGYLLLRDAIPSELVDAGCASITDEVHREGWLVEGTEPAELIVKETPPGSGMLREHEADNMMNDDAVRRVLHGAELFGVLETLFAEPAASLDYKWFRAVVPEQYSGFHMDNVCECSSSLCTFFRSLKRSYGADMGAGSKRLHTVWLPWHDIDVTKGGLV